MMTMITMDATTPTVIAVAAFAMATASAIYSSLSLMAAFSVALRSQPMASSSSYHQPLPLHPIKEEEEDEGGIIVVVKHHAWVHHRDCRAEGGGEMGRQQL
jgi:hypothetical protein